MKRILFFINPRWSNFDPELPRKLVENLELKINKPVFLITDFGLCKPGDIILYEADGFLRWLDSIPKDDQCIQHRCVSMSSHQKEAFTLIYVYSLIGVFRIDGLFAKKIYDDTRYLAFEGDNTASADLIANPKFNLLNVGINRSTHVLIPKEVVLDYLVEYLDNYFQMKLQTENNRYICLPSQNESDRFVFLFPGISNEKTNVFFKEKIIRREWLCEKIMKSISVFSPVCRVQINSLNTMGESNEISSDSSKEDFLKWLVKCEISKDHSIIMCLMGKEMESEFLVEITFELNDFLFGEDIQIPSLKFALLTYHEPDIFPAPKMKLPQFIENLNLKSLK